MSHIESRLSAIADELAAIAEAERALFDERVELWKQGRAKGIPAAGLARASRVKSVTVRQLINRSE